MPQTVLLIQNIYSIFKAYLSRSYEIYTHIPGTYKPV